MPTLRRIPLLVPSATALLFLVSCSPKEGVDPLSRKGVLAVVDGRAITVEEVRLVMESDPDRDWSEPKALEEVVEKLVTRRLAVEAARERGYDRDPEVVRALESLMASKYERDEHARRVGGGEPSEAEIRAYYETHLPLWTSRERARVAVIFVRIEDPDSEAEVDEARERAEEALAAARALDSSVMDFGNVAVNFSDDRVSGFKGGDVGWIVRGAGSRLDPAIIEQAFALARPGEVSPVVRTAAGFAIVKLIEREPPQVRPLEKVRPAVVLALRRERLAAAEKGLRADLRRGRSIRVAEDLGPRLEAIRPAPRADEGDDDADSAGDRGAKPAPPEILEKIRELSR